MNKTSAMGIVLIIYGIIGLITATTELKITPDPALSIFIILTGLCFYLLGKDIEKPAKHQ